MTLCRYRTRPSTPRSLVKLASRAASLSTGCSSSTPTRPQVPHEMYAADSARIGTATTADAVSCEPTAMTSSGCPAPSPSSAADLGEQRPDRLAGVDERGKRIAGSPSRAISASSHSPDATVSRPVVEALVRSATRSPGEPVADQVGDEQERCPRRRGIRSVVALGGELVQGVERQELQAVAPVELGGGAIGVHGFDAARACARRGSGTGRRACGRRAAGRSRPPRSRRRCCASAGLGADRGCARPGGALR